MDQFKEYLNQAIKYRFWIAIGLAGLFPLIAYFAGTGDISAKEKAETAKIEGSNKDVQPFIHGPIYNGTWKKVVDEKAEVVTKDVDASWRKLHKKQAPLLTWPKEVEDTIPVWGPLKWPEGVDTQKVSLVVNDYLQVYPSYVDEVYKSFQPFNTEDGTGIVAAPPAKILLKPAVFDETNPPSLGKVWNAQRKLWVERTMLDIVRRVNDKYEAKNWDQAPIKQILDLEVASPQAQDQKSAAKGEALKEPDDILPPGQVAAAKSAAPAGPGGGSSGFAAGQSGMGSTSAETSSFQYISSPSDNQFITVPVAIKLYIEQERIPALLVEFQNSPMDIKVKDFELKPPTTPVVKPMKGADDSNFSMGLGIGGAGRRGDSGTLGSSAFAGKNMGGSINRPGYPTGGANGSSAFVSGGGGYDPTKSSNYNNSNSVSKAVDVKAKTLKELQDRSRKAGKKGEDDSEKEKEVENVVSNPYFNVVEVTIKGQARFYVAPPPRLR